MYTEREEIEALDALAELGTPQIDSGVSKLIRESYRQSAAIDLLPIRERHAALENLRCCDLFMHQLVVAQLELMRRKRDEYGKTRCDRP